MKVPSLNNNGKEYTVCQIKRASPEHMQSTEAIPGWEPRSYGSAFNAGKSEMLNTIMQQVVNTSYLTKSLHDGGATYIMAQVYATDTVYDFQILTREGSVIAFQIERVQS